MDPLGKDIFDKLKAADIGNTIIAGGFIRDYILGGRFKDVDVFISGGKDEHINAFFEWFHNQKEFTNLKDMTAYGHYESVSKYVFDMKYLGTIPVQVILCDSFDSIKLVDEFDFNINKCFYDGELVILDTCQRDLENYTATLSNVKSMESFTRHMERFSRWKAKYPKLRFQTDYQLHHKDYLKEREEYYRQYYERLYQERVKANQQLSTGHSGDPYTGVSPYTKRKVPLTWSTTSF